jgi:hypothetical protein
MLERVHLLLQLSLNLFSHLLEDYKPDCGVQASDRRTLNARPRPDKGPRTDFRDFPRSIFQG